MLVIVGGVDTAAAADMRAHGPLVQLRQLGDDLGEREQLLALVAQPPRGVKHLFLDRFFVAGQERSLCLFCLSKTFYISGRQGGRSLGRPRGRPRRGASSAGRGTDLAAPHAAPLCRAVTFPLAGVISPAVVQLPPWPPQAPQPAEIPAAILRTSWPAARGVAGLAATCGARLTRRQTMARQDRRRSAGATAGLSVGRTGPDRGAVHGRDGGRRAVLRPPPTRC